ncbi:MAG: response regulator transcription factor [Planctomycetaceae bacterium]|nr:response regulator transcription factor [Planctomycetaceae bacterium]
MRILVIEDEPDMQQVIAASLREEDYAVDTADDGEDGLFKARAWEYDAIVLDVMLPRMDGWTVLKRLRVEKRTPVLMLTARDAVDDRVKGLDNGADDYLTKPFELSELLARLRALIRRAAGQPRPVIEIGDISIDTGSRSVSAGGNAVSLTAKEYTLLEFLARNRGNLVTRTMIYEHLFDEHDETLSNLVDVYISNIRRKVGRDFITTRRGQGYIIDG